jgi:predicted TIM-barrel fold metal-dependent hydrolase
MKQSINIVITLILISTQSYVQVEENDLPILDMHLHALPANFMGPAPLAFCLPTKQWPVKEVNKPYKETFIEWEKNPTSIDPNCNNLILSAESDEEIMIKTFEIMDKRNVIGITSGPLTKKYQQVEPDRIIPALMFNMMFSKISIDSFRTLFENGEYKVFGEITNQYSGIGPNDDRFQAYLKVAEELDIPVGIHMGPGPPGVAYVNSPHYRGKLHDPLLLEETLIKFPNLRIYICHAGWPMIDNLLALLWTHPQVYVDIGIIVYALPPKEFHSYLQRIVEAGFGNRVMFGSDQMVWPETLEVSIQTIENAEYLSDNQKRDIFYNNAARFLNLSEETIAKHHKLN